MKKAVKLIGMVAVISGAFVASSCCSSSADPAPVSAPTYVAPAK